MAVTDQQKLDFLLKKIGYTKTKTGSVVGTGAITGTGKQPFAEAIPSPLVVPNSSLWNEAASIPATPPGSDTPQVKVYLVASSGLRMTADATSSGSRAFIAYSTYNDTSSTRLTNWIDTQFGAGYLIKVYKGDPNSGGVALSAAGSGSNDGWFFDYSAGVLNFNDTIIPSGVTDTNIYIVGYRYIGQTGAPTSGISTFSNLDLTVERNLDVGKQGGISTFRHNVQLLDNDKLQFGNSQDLEIYHDSNHSYIDDTGTGNLKIRSGTIEVSNLAGSKTSAVFNSGSSQDLYFNDTKRFETTNTGINVIGDGVFSGNVSIGGTLTYEDVKNVDSVGIVTARAGIRVTGGVIEAQAGENKIPSLYSAMGNLPSAGSYHGMFAHVHATGRGYFAHAGNWLELVNKEVNGVVGTGTERYNIGNLVSTSSTTTSLNVSGVTTTTTLDVNGDLDVDGHTNLDNVSIAGITTTTGHIYIKADNKKLFVGNDYDIQIYNDGSNSWLQNINGQLIIRSPILAIQSSSHNQIIVRDGAEVELFYKGIMKLETASSGISVVGTTTSTQLAITGVSTFTGAIDANGDLDVDGHTNLDNVSIAGVTSVASLTSGRVVTAGTGGKLQDSNNLTFDGSNLFVSGINITGGGATSILGADIVTRNFKATGISTFEGNARFNSTITAGGSAGSNGQYLKTTGSGVEWATFPTLRTRQTFTASSGQTTFSFSYTINFIDVFVNGIKLTDAEFTATNGSTVVLAVGCFVGDIVELVSYNTVSGGGGGGGGISNVVEDTTPQLGGNLDLFNKSITGTGNVNITGIITATNFVGDGSGLTNVIGSGSGVVVKNSGSTVGTAGTIDFGDNLSVSAISAGIVTITGSAGVDTSQFNVNKLDVSGISTFKSNIDVNADLDVDGHTNLDNVSVAGVTTFAGTVNTAAISASGALSVSDIRSNALTLKNAAGSASYAVFSNGGSALLKWNNTDRLETTTSGITVTGTVAATSYTGDGSQLTGITAGISTISGVVNIVNDLDVDGHTNLDNVSIAGVTTFSSDVVISSTGPKISLNDTNNNPDYDILNTDGTFQVNDTTNGAVRFRINSGGQVDVLQNLDVGSNIKLGNAGVVTATEFHGSFVGNGSGLTGVVASGSGIIVKDDGSNVGTAGTINFAEPITVTPLSAGITTVGINTVGFSVNNFDVSGIASFAQQINVTGDLNLALDNGTIRRNSKLLFQAGAGNPTYYAGTPTGAKGDHIFKTFVGGFNYERFRIGGDGDIGLNGENYGTSGQVLTSNGAGAAASWTTVSGGGGTNVGITTNLSGTFNASAGTAATINTLTGYSANDLVVEYTIYIKNGSDFQTQKLLAMRDGTTIHSTQFAVMFSSSLLVQCDATISSGNILLRATPETGVSGSTTYKIKREVM